MSTEDRVQSLRTTIALLLVYLICLVAALVSCHYECAADVADGDFAWCEQVIPADYQLTNPKRTAYQL